MSQARTPPTPNDNAGFGIYVHWPFCAQKCPYCDFNSHVRFEGWDEDRFLAAYKRELDTFARHVPKQMVSSIFFGGGTPSLMKGETVGAILDHIACLWPVTPDVEITLEANPGSVEAARFQDYRTAGVNRVSIGVQALIDADLKALGRIHSVADAKSAVAIAANTFDRFSFDLIYARSGQTDKAWRAELHDALAMAGGHLSLYQLTIEDGTPFAERFKRGQLTVPDEDAALTLYETTQELTACAGLPAYEISNHAVSGQESEHNLIYWRYGAYVGVGPGAHGRVTWDGEQRATATCLVPEDWCQKVESDGHGLTQNMALSQTEQADELLMMGLRLTEGIDIAQVCQLSGKSFARDVIDDLRRNEFIEYSDDGFSQPSLDDRSDVETKTLFGGELKACLGPGLSPGNAASKHENPVTTGRLRVTAKGRFVLNKIVYQLASNTLPVSKHDGAIPSESVAQQG